MAGGGGGGGTNGGSSAANTLTGVAAVGTPIVNGAVNVVCAAGGALTPSTTDSTGSWQVALHGQTLPCAVQVSGGTINGIANPTSYHSIAISPGTVNITPLTDLMVANLVGNKNPSIWFSGLSTSPSPLSSITKTQVDIALANLNAAFPILPLYASGNNPITSAFTPTAGNSYDDMLSAVQTAMNNSGITYATLLSDASSTNFTTPQVFVSALTTSYEGTTTGKDAVYYPVNASVTLFNATSLTITMAGNYNGKSLVLTGSNTPVTTSQTFLGQLANSANSSTDISVDGANVASEYGMSYFSVAPYKNLGYISADYYTVYANQISLPIKATIGSSGNLDTGTDYTDSTRTTVLDTFVETWSLQAGTVAGTASLCINTVTTAVANSETSGSSNYCMTIDSSGKILGVKATEAFNGTNVTLTSTNITSNPPMVISTKPAGYATEIATNSVITATFSAPVDLATVTAATFTLMNNTTPVSGTVTLVDGITATFTPSAPLIPNTLYTATITTGVKNAFGNALSTNYSWLFRTSLPPAVVSTSPLPYVYPVALDGVITATFNVAMDPVSVTSSTFTLLGGTTPVAGSVTCNGSTATFTPSVPLASNTIYRATIKSGARDNAGTSMGADYSWTFQTFAPGTAVTPIPFTPSPVGLWQPISGSTPATGNFVYLQSDVGDYIGLGQTYTYTPLNAILTVSETGGTLSVGINGNKWWNGNFKTPNVISQLQPGYYPGLMRYPFNNPVLGGLTWYGDGRGCNTSLGWFVIDNVSYVSGTLTAIDLRFEQLCEGGTTALHGAIHWSQ